jgi:hypothetical protein
MTVKQFKKGNVIQTNNSGECEIIEYNSHEDITIQFKDTNYIKKTNASSLRSGRVADPYKRTVYSMGYLGDGNYVVKDHFTVYGRWCNTFQRCYGPSYLQKMPSFKGCSVGSSFHCFQDFCSWYYTQYGCNHKDWHVDKDLYSKDNKIYSAKRCILIPREINLHLREWEGRGIHVRDKGINRFNASFRRQSKLFMTEKEAVKWRLVKQKEHISSLICKYEDELDPWAVERLVSRFKL